MFRKLVEAAAARPVVLGNLPCFSPLSTHSFFNNHSAKKSNHIETQQENSVVTNPMIGLSPIS